MIERFVGAGDAVKSGQLLARLDPQNEKNALRSAQARLVAAQGRLPEARNAFGREQALLAALYDAIEFRPSSDRPPDGGVGR